MLDRPFFVGVATIAALVVAVLLWRWLITPASTPPDHQVCLDTVLQVHVSHESLSCTHRDHVLQRGREDGTLWLCICDWKGSEARRKP